MPIRILLILSCTLLLSCSDSSNSQSYTISRTGVFFTEERFDVIEVYGFTDNGEVAKQIAEFLNEDEPNIYIYNPTD